MRRPLSALSTLAVLAAVVGLLVVPSASGASRPHPATKPRPALATPTPIPPCATVDAEVPHVELDPALRASSDEVKAVQALVGVTTDSVYGPITAGAIPASAKATICSPDYEVKSDLHAAVAVLVAATPALTEQALARRVVYSSGPAPSRCNGDFSCFGPCTIAIEAPSDTYATNTGNGYYGAYQFDQGTWNGAVERAGFGQYAGSTANQAPPSVQDAAAAQLYAERGNQPWGGRC